MTQATTRDYWISPSALHIELNALGNPDYIQASCISGAQILVYVKNIIGFDAGHNYRRWSLQAVPTVFNTHTEKYVYAAIPRDMTLTASALIVFPSEQVDIYGKNEKEEQIGDEKYYYIFLQGIITSSGDNGTVQRDWKEGCRIVYGYLSSDEAISAIPYESEWYNYASVDGIVTFLKDITMKAGSKFRQLFAKTLTIVSGGHIAFEGQGEVNGVATTGTQFESTDKIVTPKFLDDNALSKVKQDVAQKLIRFLEGIAFGEQSDNNPLGISSDGIATLKEVVSAAFRSGALGSGFKLGDYNGSGDSYLEVDRLLVRKAAEFVKLVIRELQSVGGEIVLSPAAMKISNVVYFEKFTVLPEYDGSPLRYDVYRCYFSQKKGDEEIENQFVMGDLVRCQTFNVKEGVSENVKNRYYWRKVYKVGKDFIDVLADFCDTGSDIPQAGDELVQMGNTTDTARQSVVVLSAYGADAPSLKMYEGVDSYSLENKEVFVLSRQEMFAIADKFRFVTRKANGEIKSTQSFAELVMSVDGLRTTVKNNKSEVDGQIATISSQITQTAGKITTLTNEQTAMGNKISKIEQSTEKISLQVETTTNLKNCIVGSALRPWDDIVKIAAGLSQAVNIINGGGVGGSNYAVFNAQGATANTWTGLCFKDVRVTPGKKYIFSVWVRVLRATDSGAYYTIKRFDNGVAGAVVESKNYPNIVGDWALYTSQITVPSGCSRLLIETAIRKNGTINLCRLMLMEGTEYGGWSLSPYDKTEAGKLETDLKSTGIDIENGKITATADKFEVRNNSGEITASVNEKGEFETYSGLFSGFVRKRLTTITPNNIDKYLSKKKPIQNGYVTLDFVAAGSYIELSGNFGSKLGSAYPVVTLPFYQPANTAWKALVSDSLIGEAFTPKGAAAYLGQTFIIRNNTSGSPTTTINLVGYTSLVGGKDISKPYWLERGWMAILTCELVYVPANRTYSIVWNGYNVPFESPTAQSDDGKPVNDGGEQEAMSDDPTTEEEQPKE